MDAFLDDVALTLSSRGLLDYLLATGGWVRYSRDEQTQPAQDVDLVLAGSDPRRFVDLLQGISEVARRAEGIYLFSDFVAQPPIGVLAQMAHPGAVGLHLMIFRDFGQMASELPPVMLESIGRDLIVCHGDPARFEALLPDAAARAAAQPFRERVRLPIFIAQWYSLPFLANRHLEESSAGRTLLADGLRKFTKYIAKFTLAEILREEGAPPSSLDWPALERAFGARRIDPRLADLSDRLGPIWPVFEGSPLPLRVLREAFLESVRFLDEALTLYEVARGS